MKLFEETLKDLISRIESIHPSNPGDIELKNEFVLYNLRYLQKEVLNSYRFDDFNYNSFYKSYAIYVSRAINFLMHHG